MTQLQLTGLLSWLQVGKAVRMVLYQLGVLEGVAGGAQALRHWSSGFDEVNVLTAEVKAQAALMLPAPKMLLKVRMQRCAAANPGPCAAVR